MIFFSPAHGTFVLSCLGGKWMLFLYHLYLDNSQLILWYVEALEHTGVLVGAIPLGGPSIKKKRRKSVQCEIQNIISHSIITLRMKPKPN